MPRRQLSQLLLFVFVDVIGYTLFFPLLPYYAADFGAGASLVGLMIASNAGAQFLVSPLVGRLSDRFGRRPLIMVSIVGTMISFLLLAVVEPLSAIIAKATHTQGVDNLAAWAIGLLFFCRILDGAAGGNISLARAYVSDITTEENRAQGLGLIGAAFGFGFVFGPALGGTLSNWPGAAIFVAQWNLPRFAVPAFAAVAIGFINLLGVIFFLPESLPESLRLRSARRIPGPRLGDRKGWWQTRLVRLLGLRLIFSLAITLFMANFALFSQSHLAFTDQTTSYMLAFAGTILILVQAIGIRWLTRRFDEMRIVWVSAMIVTVSLLGLMLADNALSMLVILFPLATSGGVMNTLVNSLVSKSVEKEGVGEALGLATSMESLSWVIAPIIGGAVIDFFGGAAFAIVAGLFAGLMIPYIRLALMRFHGTAHAP